MRRRVPVALFFLGAGVLHFVKPGAYEPTVPDALPAHRDMAVNAERFRAVPEALLWVRLPLQAVLIAWVWRASPRRA